jgi:hypothetical protein
MAFEFDAIAPLGEKDTAIMADLLQKMEAIDAALAVIQTERATAESAWNKKTTFLNQQKDNIKDSIRALRTVTVKEV